MLIYGTVPMPLPPLDEPRRIAARLDALQAKADAIRAAQLETQRELEALMPAVLNRAFRGEL
jgi:type I restriction enzyme S subunit